MTDSQNGNRWIFFPYLALLVWIPIPLGSNRAWSVAVLEVWVLLLAVAWLVGFVRGRNSLSPAVAGARPVLFCMAAWLAIAWLHLLPLPFPLLEILSPEAARWHGAAAIAGNPAWAPLTLDLYATLDGACRSTAYVAFFGLTLVLLRDTTRIRLATYAVVTSGVLQSIYGVATAFQNLGGLATGSFVNRNHFAAYLVMCLSVGIGVLIASLSGSGSRSWRESMTGMIGWLISPKMGLRLLIVAMVIPLVLTRSRMGNIAFFIGLLVTGLIGLVLSRKATRSMVVLLASLVVIDLFLVGAYFGAQRVVERIGETTMQTEDRDEVAQYALRMWSDFPLLGSGLGSFPSVFPRYSGQGTAYSYTHAHNDYLEFAAETGAIGLGLLALIVTLSFAAALRAQRQRRDAVMRGISFASMMAIIALMVHSFADFNLQIPANALTFMLMLGFGWVSLYADRDLADA